MRQPSNYPPGVNSQTIEDHFQMKCPECEHTVIWDVDCDTCEDGIGRRTEDKLVDCPDCFGEGTKQDWFECARCHHIWEEV